MRELIATINTLNHEISEAEPFGDATAELGLVRIQELSLSEIRPSPENDVLYHPVSASDPAMVALTDSIRRHGVREPLVISLDGYILSGHRRHGAAWAAGLRSVPCRVESVSREREPEKFLVLLREYNRQRIKSLDEKLREEIVSMSPSEAYESLIEHRKKQSSTTPCGMNLGDQKQRAKISDAKGPLLDAILRVIEDLRDFLPLSVRTIHYNLLNNPPLKHASKPESIYQNDPDPKRQPNYKSLCDLVTRARFEGIIPMNAIHDPTRPITTWGVFQDAADFLRQELDQFMKGYWRDLLQSQPNHVEIVGEKNTLASTLQPIAAEYCIPLTLGRGFCSVPPRGDMARRYNKSGKGKLVVLVVGDHDPDGEQIASSLPRSMRDDFGIKNVEAQKVAMTHDQVVEYALRPGGKAKPGSRNYAKFVEQYGTDVYEIEALHPRVLQDILKRTIDAWIDTDAFNAELDREREEAVFLEATRRRMAKELTGGWRT